MENLGKKIKKLRLAKRWAQSFVADLLEISIPAYSKIENNITNLTVTRVRQLAEVFNVPIEALMVGEAVHELEKIKKELEKRLPLLGFLEMVFLLQMHDDKLSFNN